MPSLRGIANSQQGEPPFQAGDVISLRSDEQYPFTNVADERLKSICVTPAPNTYAT